MWAQLSQMGLPSGRVTPAGTSTFLLIVVPLRASACSWLVMMTAPFPGFGLVAALAAVVPTGRSLDQVVVSPRVSTLLCLYKICKVAVY
jgi:hypothetical protein